MGRVILAVHVVDLQLGFVDRGLERHLLPCATATILAACRTDESIRPLSGCMTRARRVDRSLMFTTWDTDGSLSCLPLPPAVLSHPRRQSGIGKTRERSSAWSIRLSSAGLCEIGGLRYGTEGAGIFEPPSSSIRAMASSSKRRSVM